MTTYTPNRDDKAYRLARLADVHNPDSLESPGAKWLESVRDALADDVARTKLAEGDSYDADELFELADSAVEIYTYARWQIFTDLCMWEVDTDDISGDQRDMTALAGYAQFEAARTLMDALLTEWADEA